MNIEQLKKQLIGKTATIRPFQGYGEIVDIRAVEPRLPLTGENHEPVIYASVATQKEPFLPILAPLSDLVIHRRTTPKPYRITLQRLVKVGIIKDEDIILVDFGLTYSEGMAYVIIAQNPGRKIYIERMNVCFTGGHQIEAHPILKIKAVLE